VTIATLYDIHGNLAALEAVSSARLRADDEGAPEPEHSRDEHLKHRTDIGL
jgi:hypothetical protein